MNLWDKIKGQDTAVCHLRKSLQLGKIAPAYLFQGPTGVGKRMTAYVLAQALNCRRGGGGPCGECDPCRQIEKKSYPDLLWIHPRGKARQIKIDSLREMQRTAHLATREGSWKVIILEDADTMNAAAANSLLKTLEEPPDRTIFVLLSSRPERLLPTIRSRCRAVKFKAWSEELMRSFLQRKAGLTGDRALLLYRLAGGRPGRALQLNEEGFFRLRDRVRELIGGREPLPADSLIKGIKTVLEQIKDRSRERELIRSRENRELLEGAEKEQLEEWQKEAEALLEAEKLSDLDLVFELFYSWFRDLYVFRATGLPDLLINADQLPEIKAASSSWSSGRLWGALRWVKASREAVLGRITTSQQWIHQLVLENMLIQIRNK